MSHRLWRIGTDTLTYTADDLSGTGARITGGRWNSKGTAVTYTSSSRALACLETVVHLNASGLPLNRYLVEVTVPKDIWARRETIDPAQHVGWDAEPAGLTSTEVGTRWITERRSALLCVPSVIVPEEDNILINPAHADATRITAQKVRRWLYDPRLAR
ncbi:RES family NAD+ phosphorylase [Sphingomonas sp. PL-96]|uniref:RES family NAD+ phosphorylase n=1 Tax=Sphingomonas sp. PL-96 TaxID=2887201 RepID=UPI001E3DF5BB|nr:RES family NAD+ phosphorylase [Sphingomonas sp. PL-96]MCC2978190.1 RES family NAD+ phosphorylase [Sphingomonas sp. PL-96]